MVPPQPLPYTNSGKRTDDVLCNHTGAITLYNGSIEEVEILLLCLWNGIVKTLSYNVYLAIFQGLSAWEVEKEVVYCTYCSTTGHLVSSASGKKGGIKSP